MQVDANDANVCMMEGCSEADLLPAKCGKCLRRFCSRHLSYDAHHCNRNYEAQVVPCPVCNATIPCPAGQDPNLIVSRHIDSGCRILQDTAVVERAFPTHEQIVRGIQPSERHNYCTFQGCTKNELVLLLCEKCGQSFCVNHRTPTKHECPALTPPPAAPLRRSPSVSPPSSSSGNQKAAIRNTKQNPVGSYKGDAGMVCLVYLDRSAPSSSGPSPSSSPSAPSSAAVTGYYFRLSRLAVVGRAVDQFCAAVDALSSNVMEQWYFYNVSRGGTRLEAGWVAGDVVAEGEVLYCSRESELQPEVQQAMAAALQQKKPSSSSSSAAGSSGAGCSVM